MNLIRIETDRLILRKFEESDMEAIYSLLSDEEVNTFLPWYPVKDMAEAKCRASYSITEKMQFILTCPGS